MLSTAYVAFLHNLKKERYDTDDSMKAREDLKIFMTIFVLILVIDLVIMFYALYCLFNSQLEWYVTLLVLVLMFSPGLGFITSLGVIFYYHAVFLQKPKNAVQPIVGKLNFF